MMNRSKRVGAVFAKALAAGVLMATAGLAQALPVSGQGTWETTLQARDLNGDTITDAFYDTALNITWLRNASENGLMNWNVANFWANSLSFGGYTDWRLPTMVDTGTSGCNFSFAGGTDCGYNVQTATSEMAHLFHETLGNLSAFDTAGVVRGGPSGVNWGLANTGEFENMQSFAYWSGLEDASLASDAWYFNAVAGNQGNALKTIAWYALAVRPGDVVAAVPEPESLALVLVGLVAAGVARRRRPL